MSWQPGRLRRWLVLCREKARLGWAGSRGAQRAAAGDRDCQAGRSGPGAAVFHSAGPCHPGESSCCTAPAGSPIHSITHPCIQVEDADVQDASHDSVCDQPACSLGGRLQQFVFLQDRWRRGTAASSAGDLDDMVVSNALFGGPEFGTPCQQHLQLLTQVAAFLTMRLPHPWPMRSQLCSSRLMLPSPIRVRTSCMRAPAALPRAGFGPLLAIPWLGFAMDCRLSFLLHTADLRFVCRPAVAQLRQAGERPDQRGAPGGPQLRSILSATRHRPFPRPSLPRLQQQHPAERPPACITPKPLERHLSTPHTSAEAAAKQGGPAELSWRPGFVRPPQLSRQPELPPAAQPHTGSPCSRQASGEQGGEGPTGRAQAACFLLWEWGRGFEAGSTCSRGS